MKNNWKRMISVLLALCMVVSLFPLGVLADTDAPTATAIVPGSDSDPILSFIFKVDGTEYARQNIRSGESLAEPAAPYKESMKFLGWFDESGTQFTSFNQPLAVTDEEEITLTAKFDEVFYVYFLNAENGAVLLTKEGKNGATVSVSDVTLHLYADTALTGWKDESGNTVGDSVVINGSDIVLTPIISSGYWITYESGSGSSYIWPTFVPPMTATRAPETPVRPGYNFSHWSLTENGTPYTFGSPLTESITLHAVWTNATNTEYLVIHWWENADDTEYSFHESEIKRGTTNASTAASAKSYDGFTAQSITQKTIAADGTTIVDVYYNRNVYSITFMERSFLGWSTINNLTITAKYGAHIGNLWPSSTSSIWGTTTSRGEAAEPWQSGIETMPLGGDTFYKPSSSGSRYTMELYYYTEVLDGTPGARTYNGKNYALNHKDVFTSSDNSWRTTEEDHYPIIGFTYTNNLPDGSYFTRLNNSNTYYVEFFYTRNDYNIVFINGGSTESTITKQYGADLSDVSYTPARPSTVPVGYTFAGWYDNKEHAGSPVVFDGQTMPAGNLAVYAKWVEPEVSVTFYNGRLGTANNTVFQSFHVDYGTAIPNDMIPTYPLSSTYDWIGWVTADGSVFHFDTKIYQSINLYPYYVSQTSFTVTYNANGGKGTVPTDSNTYLEFSEAVVKTASGLTKDNQHFLGWNTAADGSGTTYQPNSKVQILSNVTLYAKWGDLPADNTSLTYDANNGSGKTYVLNNLPNNTKHTVLSLDSTGFSYANHNFLGWSKNASATEPDYLPNDKIIVSNSGSNVLYAVWESKFTSYTVNYFWNDTTTSLAASKTVDDMVIGSTVTNEAPVSINGYTPVAGQTASLVLDADSSKNVINFYYYKNVTLTANSDSVKYDGGAKNVSGFTADDTNAVFDGIAVGASGTDAAVYPANFNDGVIGTVDSTGKYIVSAVVNGSLTIQPRNITLTSGSAEKVYDGQPLTNETVTVSGESFVNGDSVSYTVTGTRTYVGVSDNIFTYTLNEGTKEQNYNITRRYGTLTVTDRGDVKYEITVEANSGEYLYDGNEKTVSGLKTTTFTINGVTYTVEGLTASAAGTNAGKYISIVNGTPTVLDNNNVDVTEQFIVQRVEGVLTINKRRVTFTSASDQKEYDGTPLTNHNVTVGGDGFAEKDANLVAFNVTGSQTLVGISPNTFDYVLTNRQLSDNYTITKIEGELRVVTRDAKYEVSVYANDGEFLYDGTEKSVTGFKSLTVTVDNRVYTVSGLTAEGKATDAGNHFVTVSGTPVVTDAYGNDVTNEFDVDAFPGRLIINKRNVTLTSATRDKEYDGTPLFDHTVTVGGDGFANGESVNTHVTGSQTLVGTVPNTFTYTPKDGINLDNYVIHKIEGQLTVHNRSADYKITVEANSGEFLYDGTEKTVSGFKTLTFTVSDKEYTVEGLTAFGAGTDAGTYSVTVSGTAVVRDSAGNDVSDQFDVSFVHGEISIAKRTLILTSESDVKQYDGTPLTNHTITVSGDGFAEGEGAEYTVTGIQTLPGSSENRFTYAPYAGTKRDNYTITFNYGTLTVTDRAAKYEITLHVNSGEYLYDGRERTVSGFRNTVFEVAGLNFSVTGVTASVSAIDAGIYPVQLTGTPIVLDEAGNDVTDQFIIHIDHGTLTINKRMLTLVSARDSKFYDGTPLKNSTISIIGAGFADNEGAEYTVTGSQLLPGESDNTFTYQLWDNTKADNYNISVAFSKLIVFPVEAKYEITVVTNNGEFMYDGTEKTVTGFETLTFNVNGSTYTVSGIQAKASGTNAGIYPVVIGGSAIVKDAEGNDVSDLFAVSYRQGTMQIKKRNVTMTSGNAEKVYDGLPLTNHTVTVTGDGFADGEGASYTVTGERTLPGTGTNHFEYTLNENTKATNYNITKLYGNLTINNRGAKYEINVKAKSDEVIYNGKTHYITELEQTQFAVDGGVYRVVGLNVEGFGTDAGEYTVRVWGTPVVLDNAGNDVTAQFTVHTANGLLVIKQRNVTVTSASDVKEYDGLPLRNQNVTVTGDGFVNDEGLIYTFTGSQTLVGTSSNLFTYAAKANTKLSNYIINEEYGTLTVTDRVQKYEITLEANSGTFTYNGKEQIVSGFKTLTFTVNGNVYTADGVAASAAATDAGTYPVIIQNLDQLVIRDAVGNDVTSQFIVEAINGTMTILPRRVVLSSVSLEKEYDGTPLTNGTNPIIVSEGGFVVGEGVDVTFTGSQTNVGTSANAFTYTMKSGTKAANYQIRVSEGQLKVVNRSVTTQYEITLIANSADLLYTGKPEYVSGFQTTTFVLDGKTYTVSGVEAFAEGVDAGKYTVNITGDPVVTAEDGTDVTDHFKIDYVRGTLNIRHREIYLVSADLTRVYNGLPLTNGNTPLVNVNKGDGFVDGEGVNLTFTGSQTLPGTTANSFTYTLKDGTKAINYHIHKEEGQLTVTSRNVAYKVYLTANSDTFMYDGTEKTVSGFHTLVVGVDSNNNNFPDAGEPMAEFNLSDDGKIEFTWNGVGYTLTGLTAIGSGTAADEYAVTASGSAVILNEAGDDVSSQFAVIVKEGTLTINKRALTMTSPTATKQYDGKPLIAHGITVTGDGFVEGEGASYNEVGSQTYVGDSPNYFFYTLNQGTMAENYDITVVYGKLIVTDRADKYEIELVANSGTFLYDGTEKTVEGFQTLTFTMDGVTYTVSGVTASATAVDAGTYTVAITGTPVVLGPEGNDLTSLFQITTVNGTMTINRRNVYLTSASAIKEYDGTPLTNHLVSVTGDGFAQGEGAQFIVTGSQTEVGVSDNTFSYTLNANTKAENYNITVIFGELEVVHTSGSATLHKVDSADMDSPLEDAVFELYYVGAYDILEDTYITDINGMIEVSQLYPGMYYWKEVSAPEGYMLDTQKYYFTVESGEDTVLTVTNTRTAVPEVFSLEHFAYVIGYPDGTVRPEAPITRAEVATIFFRLLNDDMRNTYMTKDNPFSDVNPDDWFNTAVSTMFAMGIIKGYPDGTFHPGDFITRAEFAAIAARFDENGDNTPAQFKDMYNHWSAEEVSIAANNGWLLGYDDNTFHPDQNITRAEAMTVINRVLQRIVKDHHDLLSGMINWIDNADTTKWYYLAVQEATNSHEYRRETDGYEVWVALKPNRDWKEFEE